MFLAFAGRGAHRGAWIFDGHRRQDGAGPIFPMGPRQLRLRGPFGALLVGRLARHRGHTGDATAGAADCDDRGRGHPVRRDDPDARASSSRLRRRHRGVGPSRAASRRPLEVRGRSLPCWRRFSVGIFVLRAAAFRSRSGRRCRRPRWISSLICSVRLSVSRSPCRNLGLLLHRRSCSAPWSACCPASALSPTVRECCWPISFHVAARVGG